MTKIENIARDIVAEWLAMFDPPPQIDFQQSEMLQASIVAALRAAARPPQEPVAWRIEPSENLFLTGSTITDEPDVADIWRKAGCVVEPLFTQSGEESK
jgi:hypothetical protein